MCLLALYERAKSRNFRLRLYEYFLCQAFQFRERLDATTTFCNVADRFTLRSLTLFRVCSCVYVNFSFMKRQQNLSLFLTPKRVATESEDQGELEKPNDEGGEISTTASQPAEVAELPVIGLFRLYNYDCFQLLQ